MQVEGFRKTGYNLSLKCEDGRTLKIKPCLIQLGFDIKVIVLSEKSLEEMLNLNRLNEFILSNID